MAEAPATTPYEVTCPHCRKPFSAELLPGSGGRLSGFKCPHCRLYVPLERVTEPASN
jgi:transposase-like protein